MTKLQLTSALSQYGLSINEAKSYEFLLKKIEATAYEVAQKVKVPRTTIYKALESLKDKGFVVSFKKNGKLHFTPENPNQFYKKLKRKQEIIDSIMPEMRALIESPDIKPVIKLYEGKEGLKKVWDDILETAKREKIKRLYAISHPTIYELLPKYFPEWVKKRVALGISVQIILPDIESARSLDNKELRIQKYLPKKHPYQSTVDIYGDKIAFFSLKKKEVNSIILESPTLAEMFRSFFLTMWELLP